MRDRPEGHAKPLISLYVRVDALDRDPAGCRPWRGALDKDGYGVTTLRLGGTRIPGSSRVHRRVLEAVIGRSLGRDEVACHSCDNPQCVEPAHLSAGSVSDNIRQSHDRGRAAGLANIGSPAPVRGEAHGRHKLTEAEVGLIREGLVRGDRQAILARRFGVSQASISNICRGKNWTHTV